MMKSHPCRASAVLHVEDMLGSSSNSVKYFMFLCCSLMPQVISSDRLNITTSCPFRATAVAIAVPNEPLPNTTTFIRYVAYIFALGQHFWVTEALLPAAGAVHRCHGILLLLLLLLVVVAAAGVVVVVGDGHDCWLMVVVGGCWWLLVVVGGGGCCCCCC